MTNLAPTECCWSGAYQTSPRSRTSEEWRVLVQSLVSYHIHIHSICLKSKEGGFNNHGYMAFKERWDMGKRSIEWMRNFKGFLRALPHPYTHRKHTCRHTRACTHTRRPYCIYICMSITKGFSCKWEQRTSFSTWDMLFSNFERHKKNTSRRKKKRETL